MVERSKASGCKPDGLISYVGSNPTPCTRIGKDKGERIKDKVKSLLSPFSFILSPLRIAGVAQLVERQPSKLNVASSSLVSRSNFLAKVVLVLKTRPSSSGVERILGKDDVAGSNPALGSRHFGRM